MESPKVLLQNITKVKEIYLICIMIGIYKREFSTTLQLILNNCRLQDHNFQYLMITFGRFHVTFSLRSPISLKFWQDICQPKKSKQPKFQLKKQFFGVSTPVLLFVAIFFEQKLFFAFFATNGLDRQKKIFKNI